MLNSTVRLCKRAVKVLMLLFVSSKINSFFYDFYFSQLTLEWIIETGKQPNMTIVLKTKKTHSYLSRFLIWKNSWLTLKVTFWRECPCELNEFSFISPCWTYWNLKKVICDLCMYMYISTRMKDCLYSSIHHICFVCSICI